MSPRAQRGASAAPRGAWTRLALALLASACRQVEPAREPPPLADLQQPAALLAEPDDEAQRRALPAGAFSGVYVGAGAESLDALLGEPAGLAVASVVENSPADLAGLAAGDLLLEARVGGGAARALAFPSEWRALELETPPGTAVELLVERAGAERRAELVLEPRAHPGPREPAARLREEQRVGVVVRGTTEVEARQLGIGPGAGAVVVGLARTSPWRDAGVVYEDVVLAVDGEPLAHPGALLDRVRTAPEDAALELEIARAGTRLALSAPLSRREREQRELGLWPLVSYRNEEGTRRLSLLFGALAWQRTSAAWRVRVLWVFGFGRGDGDELAEVDE